MSHGGSAFRVAGLYVGCAIFFALSGGLLRADEPSQLAALPELESPNERVVELGRILFFDKRLAGDATLSCADCHQPGMAFVDGLPLSKGYPGSLYFRNTPTLLNVAHRERVYWDGRLAADDLPTVVRDHISEAHFLQADGRLVIERLRQVPFYEQEFSSVFGGEPTYGRILNSVAVFVASLEARNAPLDRYLAGDEEALSESARAGLDLFQGKAGCIRCHNGPLLTNHKAHGLGLESSAEIFRTPERHITFRRFLRTLGVPDYENIRTDVGVYCVSKEEHDFGRFVTPSLRNVAETAPYMHDGQLGTLEDVVAFYNQGGGGAAGKDELLQPLDLSEAEQSQLVEFLKSLSGELPEIDVPEIPGYELRSLGQN